MREASESADRATPWSLVILAVLPGLAMTLGATISDTSLPWAVLAGAIVAPGMAGLIIAIARRSFSALPAWSLLSAGFLPFALSGVLNLGPLPAGSEESVLVAGLLLMLIVLGAVARRARPGKPPALVLWLPIIAAAAPLLQLAFLGGRPYYGSAISWLFLAPVAAFGLLLAPAHGLRAALVLLPLGAFMMSFDIEHPIYFWEAPDWSRALTYALPLLLWGLLPAWVLRARSPLGQAIGLLLPPALYYLLLVAILATRSSITDWADMFAIARPVVALFSVLAVFGAVCAWLGPGKEGRGGESQLAAGGFGGHPQPAEH